MSDLIERLRHTALIRQRHRAEDDPIRKDCDEAAAELTRLSARVAELEGALNKPLTFGEITEIGKAILPYINQESTKDIGMIAWSVSIAIRNVILARAALKDTANG